MILLALDIGNSTTKAGLFQEEKLLAWDKIITVSRPATLKSWLNHFLSQPKRDSAGIEAIAIGSVVPSATVFWQNYLRKDCPHPFILTGETPTRLKVNYRPRRSLGADRLANALAASHLYRPPVICVSLGTATVIDAVSFEGIFLGGEIFPGLELSAKSLAGHTALLPKIAPSKQPSLIGDNTEGAIAAGALYGSSFAVQGLVRAYRKLIGRQAKLVITGGCAPLILPHLSGKVYHRPTLTLEGIRLAWEDVGK